jgi:DNA-binding CsgD family transcriptional regulator
VHESYTERWLRHQAGFQYLAVGDLAKAQKHLEAMVKLETRLRAGRSHARSFHLDQAVSMLTGDWNRAREYMNRGLEYNPTDIFSLHYLAILEYETGNLAECDLYLTKVEEAYKKANQKGSESYRAIACLCLAKLCTVSQEAKRLALAQSIAESILALPFVKPFSKLHAQAALSVVAVQRSDKKMAARQNLEELTQVKHFMPLWGIICVDRLLGRLMEICERYGAAQQHYRDAIGFLSKAGYRCELAWALYDFAGLLLSRNDAADRERAESNLDQAMAVTQELGMKTLAKLIGKRMTIASASTRSHHLPSTLTNREMEVLRLMALGKTNQEIAYDLFISEYTVGNHVSKILTKTKTTNRTEAARYAARHNLVET